MSLDLTWTLRFRMVRPTELLVTRADLRRWVLAAGLPLSATPSDRELVDARELREAIARAAVAVIEARPVGAEDRRIINRCAAHPPPTPVLRPGGSQRVEAPGDGISAALSATARDAIELLTAQDGRLRRCAGPQCSLLFHDGSRPGSRRWCATSRCGNKVNTKAYRGRQRDQGPGTEP